LVGLSDTSDEIYVQNGFNNYKLSSDY